MNVIGRLLFGVAGLWCFKVGADALVLALMPDDPRVIGRAETEDERLERAQRVIERLEEENAKLREPKSA